MVVGWSGSVKDRDRVAVGTEVNASCDWVKTNERSDSTEIEG